MKSQLMPCSACGKDIAQTAQACPHCGAPVKKPLHPVAWVVVGFTVFLMVAGYYTLTHL